MFILITNITICILIGFRILLHIHNIYERSVLLTNFVEKKHHFRKTTIDEYPFVCKQSQQRPLAGVTTITEGNREYNTASPFSSEFH